MERRAIIGRHCRQGARALWRSLCGVPRSGAGLCLLSLCDRQGFPEFPQWRDHRAIQRVSGRIDQGAGILFNLKPNGDYLTIRANCLENNLVLWKFEKGRRSSVKWISNTPTPSGQWHDLKVRIAGTKVEGYLDGKLYLEDRCRNPCPAASACGRKPTATCTSAITQSRRPIDPSGVCRACWREGFSEVDRR